MTIALSIAAALLLYATYRVVEGALVCTVMFGGMAGIGDRRKAEGESDEDDDLDNLS